MPIIIELPGTMYNIIYGTNRYAYFWLGMLGLPPDTLGRFRDCYLRRGPEGLEICIYTRNGGAFRRRPLALVPEMLRTHPLYLCEYNEQHDPTYIAYIFRPTNQMRPLLEFMVLRDPEHTLPGSHLERAEAFFRKMIREPTDPEVQRVKAIMGSVFSRRSQSGLPAHSSGFKR